MRYIEYKLRCEKLLNKGSNYNKILCINISL